MAREQGLTEKHVEQINDDYEDSQLSERDKTALQLTDAIVGDPRQVPESLQKQLRTHFSDPQIVEMSIGIGLFLALSKVLISLGLEPEKMDIAITPTPGSTN